MLLYVNQTELEVFDICYKKNSKEKIYKQNKQKLRQNKKTLKT